MKKRHPITNLRVVKTHPARIDGGEFCKARYVVRFERNGRNCCVPITNNGERRPLGQDVLDEMAAYIKRKEVSEDELLTCPVVD